jgi:hypothetical protein
MNIANRANASRVGIEAASKTYNRCTGLLLKELGLDMPIRTGLGPRLVFEETVTSLRAQLARSGGEELDLTHEDFSPNEVLRFMAQTATKLGNPKRRRIKREDFIRIVNETLQDKGGLKAVKRLHVRAKDGRFAWIDSHMSKFLRRHDDLAKLSKKWPGDIWVGAKGIDGDGRALANRHHRGSNGC